MNRKAEITAALDQEVREAVAGAAYFIASLYHQHAHERHPLKTLAMAREAARLLPAARGSTRKGIVYAVAQDGRSVMVPEDFVPSSAGPVFGVAPGAGLMLSCRRG